MRPDIVKSPAEYRTGHFPESRSKTGQDLLSGTALINSFCFHLWNHMKSYGDLCETIQKSTKLERKRMESNCMKVRRS